MNITYGGWVVWFEKEENRWHGLCDPFEVTAPSFEELKKKIRRENKLARAAEWNHNHSDAA